MKIKYTKNVKNIVRRVGCFAAACLLCAVSSAEVFPQDSQAKLLPGFTFSVPDEDRNDGIHGDIKVAIDVDEKGDVERAVIYVGPGWPCGEDLYPRVEKLVRSIEKSVSKYKFTPALKNGKPTKAKLSLSLRIPEAEPKQGNVVDAGRKLISGGVLNGKAVSLPRPAYPAAARAERVSGPVSVGVRISEQGDVTWAQAVLGHPLLLFAGRAAACSSKFSPSLLEGNPVKVSGVITYNFVP